MRMTTEICVWCEGDAEYIDTCEVDDEFGKRVNIALRKENISIRVDRGHYDEYRCPECGAVFRLYFLSVVGHHITEAGDTEKQIFADCNNCYWSVNSPDRSVNGCPCCIRGEIIGSESPDARDNWTPLTDTQVSQ